MVIYILKFMVIGLEISNVVIRWSFKYDYIIFKENVVWKVMDCFVINYLYLGFLIVIILEIFLG